MKRKGEKKRGQEEISFENADLPYLIEHCLLESTDTYVKFAH